jgi:hypothetical protein
VCLSDREASIIGGPGQLEAVARWEKKILMYIKVRPMM